MYKASLGLVGVAAVALIYGWVRQSNPATWFSIVAAIVAGLLLIASWLLERTHGGSGAFSPSGAADASGGGTWTAPPPSSSAWSPVSASYGRSSSEAFEPEFEADEGPRSASAAAASTASAPASTDFAPDRYEPDSTMAMPASQDPKRRFGRKASAPAPASASAVDERVAELRALSESTSAELFSLTEEERADGTGTDGISAYPDAGDDSPESRLARAQQEVEDLLAQPLESFRAPEPEPAPRPAPAQAPAPAPEPVRGAPSHDQDEWLQAAMRRREARKAAASSGDDGSPEAAPASSASIAPGTGPDTGPRETWTPPPGSPPPGRSAAAERVPTLAVEPVPAPAAAPAASTASAASASAAEEEDGSGEVLTWSQRRRRTRLGAEPASDYELRQAPPPVSPRRRPPTEPDEEADFELIPVPGEEFPEGLPDELANDAEEEEEEEIQAPAPTRARSRRGSASSFVEPEEEAETAPAKPAARRRSPAGA
ncbi:MAG: hypothetical protein ACRDJU_04955, partial [Actinomycetota bacterium]